VVDPGIDGRGHERRSGGLAAGMGLGGSNPSRSAGLQGQSPHWGA